MYQDDGTPSRSSRLRMRGVPTLAPNSPRGMAVGVCRPNDPIQTEMASKSNERQIVVFSAGIGSSGWTAQAVMAGSGGDGRVQVARPDPVAVGPAPPIAVSRDRA